MATIILTNHSVSREMVLVNWDNVSFAIEYFQTMSQPGSTEERFEYTKIYMREGGSSYVTVDENAQEIHDKLRHAVT